MFGTVCDALSFLRFFFWDGIVTSDLVVGLDADVYICFDVWGGDIFKYILCTGEITMIVARQRCDTQAEQVLNREIKKNAKNKIQ